MKELTTAVIIMWAILALLIATSCDETKAPKKPKRILVIHYAEGGCKQILLQDSVVSMEIVKAK